jgi:hypothetical protein
MGGLHNLATGNPLPASVYSAGQVNFIRAGRR